MNRAERDVLGRRYAPFDPMTKQCTYKIDHQGPETKQFYSDQCQRIVGYKAAAEVCWQHTPDKLAAHEAHVHDLETH